MTPASRARTGEVVLGVLLAAVALYLIAHLIAFEYGRDQGIYAVVADTVLHGGAPYKDAWDFKPPAVYFIFAASRAVLGDNMHMIRVVEALFLLSALWAFVVLSRRHLGDGRAGVVAWVTAVTVYVPLEFWHTAQPETFAVAVLAWAWVCAGHRGRRESLAWAGAGALYCVAALLKPPLGGGAVASAAVVLWLRLRDPASRPSRRYGLPVLAFFAGGMVPLAVTLIYFAAKGALGDLYETLFVFAPGYTRIGFEASQFPALFGRAVWEWLDRFSPFMIVGLIPLFALPPVHPREREGIAHVLGTVLFALAGVALQAKFFAYHYGAAAPLGGLLAGWGIWKVWLRARCRAWGWIAVPAALVVLGWGIVPGLPRLEQFRENCRLRQRALAEPAQRRAIMDRLATKGDVNMAADRAAAEWLRENTSPAEKVFIWGFEPVIYDLAGRDPASRYIYNVPQRSMWHRRAARDRLLEDLERSRPAVVIVQQNDRLPWVTGNDRDSRAELDTFPELARWIDTHYVSEGAAEDLHILSRRPAR